MANPDPSKKYHYTKMKYNIQLIEGKELLFRTVVPINKNNKKKVNLAEENLPIAIKEETRNKNNGRDS